jgi:hypothetical protein
MPTDEGMQSMPLRPVLDIEEVLRWTYRDELPKQRHDRDSGPGPYVSPMFRLCAHGGPIDNWSREPGMPLALGEPHPDALAVAEAVKELRAEDLDITDSRSPTARIRSELTWM